MSELHLTAAEVAEATGTIKRSKQIAWFMARGIPAELGLDNKVKVLRAAYEAKMMPGGQRTHARTEPKLYLIKKAG